jgi:hypothetical protein
METTCRDRTESLDGGVVVEGDDHIPSLQKRPVHETHTKFLSTKFSRLFLKPSAFLDDPLTGRLPGAHRDARSQSQLDNRSCEQHRIAAQMLGSMGEAQKMMLVVLVA